MRDGLMNVLGRLVSAVVGIILVPIMLHGLGAQRYGLWVAALALPALLSAVDLGLGWSIVRQVAGSNRRKRSDDTSRFVSAAASAYLVLGSLGGLSVAALGWPLSRGLHLSAANEEVAPIVFALAGVTLFGDQMLSFTTALFHGLRRFDVANLVSSAGVVVRAVGFIGLIASGAGLVALSLWQAAASLVMAVLSFKVVGRVGPGLLSDVRRPDWSALRPHIRFGLASQLSSGLTKLIWDVAPLLIGTVRGSAAIAPYYVGQRFPVTVNGLTSRLSEVIFPAASEDAAAKDPAGTRRALEVGTRWTTVFALPLCLVLWILGSKLLHAWVGNVSHDTVLVLRLTTAAVLAEAVAGAALHVLWGRGSARAVVFVLGFVAAAVLGLTPVLLVLNGIVGAAWGLLIPVVGGSIAVFHLGARSSGLRTLAVAREVSRGLPAAALACAATAWGVAWLLERDDWLGVLVAATASAGAYGITLYAFGARQEERDLVRALFGGAVALATWPYKRLRRALRRVWFLRTTWHMFPQLMEFVMESRAYNRYVVRRQFARRVDPWDYSNERGRERLVREAQILDAAREDRVYGDALEVGCAEGAFTEFLATRCEAVLAVDISPLALRRARARCRWPEHVRFAAWDLARDPLPGRYDLIVVEGVLDYFARPKTLRNVRAKLVEGLRLNGYLLIGNVKQGEVSEQAWWGRRFIRGGKWINTFMAKHPALTLVTNTNDGTYIETLLKRIA
jgi:O-antigen/teichoic acid export membrane protein/SAM-dependent methyltransferase